MYEFGGCYKSLPREPRGSKDRFRIPTEGTVQRLRPIMTAEELDAANLLHDPAAAASLESETEEEEGEQLAAELGERKRKRRKKRKGKVHGGLPLRLVDPRKIFSLTLGGPRRRRERQPAADAVDEQPRHDRQGGRVHEVRPTVQLQEHDVVDIWAFKQREFRLMGTPVFHESPLYILILKRDG
nr:unnamed protein product [Digitaria exilis]